VDPLSRLLLKMLIKSHYLEMDSKTRISDGLNHDRY
jgi:hypothetical protein